MDIEVVTDDGRVVGASTSTQGAELIRIGEAQRQAVYALDGDPQTYAQRVRTAYERMNIQNTELHDI